MERLHIKVAKAGVASQMVTNFMVLDTTSMCNIIIGVSALNSMKAMILTCALDIQFETDEGFMAKIIENR